MIYFMRHWSTYSSVNNLINGWEVNECLLHSDGDWIRLSFLSNIINDLKIEAIYCSSLIRAQETAQIVRNLIQYDVDVICDNWLSEQKFWKYSWQKWDDVLLEHVAYDRDNIRLLWRIVDWEESRDEFYARVIPVYERIVQSNKNVLIVAHWGTYLAIKQYIDKMSPEQIILDKGNYLDTFEIRTLSV